MKLYHSGASPFVRKINVLLHELGTSDKVERLATATTAFNSDAALVASNPLGKLPALELDNGQTIYDSRVISAYLNDHFGGDLYPQDASRWENLTLEATGDGLMDATVSMSYEVRLRPETDQSSDWIEAQWAKAARTLSVLNAQHISTLNGALTMAHISVGCALAYIDFRHEARGWRQGNDALASWFETFNARPSMQATIPVG